MRIIDLVRGIGVVFMAFSLLASAGGSAVAATIAPTTINHDTTWSAAGNPYRIDDPMRIERGATLTLEQGVEVELGRWVTVAGRLIARGTGDAYVTIVGVSNAENQIIEAREGGTIQLDRAAIQGIRVFSNPGLGNGGGSVALHSATVLGGAVGVGMNCGGCNPPPHFDLSVTDSLFIEAQLGVDVSGDVSADAVVERTLIASAKFALASRPPSAVTFRGNVVTLSAEVTTGAAFADSGGSDSKATVTANRFGPKSSMRVTSSLSADRLVVSGNAFPARPAAVVARIAGEGRLDLRDNWWGSSDPKTVNGALDRGPYGPPAIVWEPFRSEPPPDVPPFDEAPPDATLYPPASMVRSRVAADLAIPFTTSEPLPGVGHRGLCEARHVLSGGKGGVDIHESWDPCVGRALPIPRGCGRGRVAVQPVDASGNLGLVRAVDVPYDVEAPNVFFDTGGRAARTNPGGVATVPFRVVDEGCGFRDDGDVVTIECRIDDAGPTPCTSPLRLSLARGSHRVAVNARDDLGNVGSTAVIRVVVRWPLALASAVAIRQPKGLFVRIVRMSGDRHWPDALQVTTDRRRPGPWRPWRSTLPLFRRVMPRQLWIRARDLAGNVTPWRRVAPPRPKTRPKMQ